MSSGSWGRRVTEPEPSRSTMSCFMRRILKGGKLGALVSC